MAVIETGHAAARAVDDLYRRHGTDVYRYALAVLGNHADAEDVTQTTFLNAYRSLGQGVRPRKPSNWLLTIASNAIKQRFRQEQTRPRQVLLDDRIADTAPDDEGPTVGEVLTALSRIPPQQRQAIVLREFEGRSYKEMAEILGVTTSALETLLFRARRSLTEELEHQLTCTEAQFAVSQAADRRVGRKQRRRLRAHLGECPDCARFARLQLRHRRALRGLTLMPVPVSLTLFRELEGSASAATLPTIGTSAAAAAHSVGVGAVGAGGGAFAGGLAIKAAAVVTAASIAGGVGVVGAAEVEPKSRGTPPVRSESPGERLGQVAPRGVLVPGRGIAVGKADAPGQTSRSGGRAAARGQEKSKVASAERRNRAEEGSANGKAPATVPAKGANASKASSHRSVGKPKPPARGVPRARSVPGPDTPRSGKSIEPRAQDRGNADRGVGSPPAPPRAKRP
jgi:RNA polymerase sigma factor (sigma-70 family)